MFSQWLEYTEKKIVFRKMLDYYAAYKKQNLLRKVFYSLKTHTNPRYLRIKNTFPFKRMLVDVDDYKSIIHSVNPVIINRSRNQ